ncbi:hypothetical protein Sjap_013846 [Stephania japonica]|uniref:BTB/POZ domain-containing protein n=1 Tax=Stephania japonica TaxID=461633 RepID=A0AAP0IYR7_9MAGN
MVCMKLGSKPEAFQREGQTWTCKAGLPGDVVIEVGEMSFHLHKFPLLSRSGVLEKLIQDITDQPNCSLQLHDLPGGAKSFEIIAKFCYGVKVELTPTNVVSVRCAAEHLHMTEAYGEGNLIKRTEDFLNEVFANWDDTIKALESCEDVLSYAQELHIDSRCIESLANKACADPILSAQPSSRRKKSSSFNGDGLWNGICTEIESQTVGEDWWYEDASFFSLPMYKRLIFAVGSKGMSPEITAASLMFYANRHLPGLMGKSISKNNVDHVNTSSSISSLPEEDQRHLLEEIVSLLPEKKGVISTKFLLRLLHTAMKSHASSTCREDLEKRVGAQLDQAALEDLLIPNMGFTVETLYDIDCVQRILDHFISADQDSEGSSSPCIVEEGQLIDQNPPLTPITKVANLVDGYLAEVAPDVNLKLPKFQMLAAVIPDYARPFNDGIYRAIDIYLKAHPWLTDSEREQLCRLMNCQKLSVEACTHAAQNERLPLRVVVQVIFFEQLRLRTSVAGWFFVSENLENSQGQQVDADGKEDQGTGMNDMGLKVSELEKECLNMKQEIDKLGKGKSSSSWSILSLLGFKKSNPKNSNTSKPCNSKATASPPSESTSAPVNGGENHEKH